MLNKATNAFRSRFWYQIFIAQIILGPRSVFDKSILLLQFSSSFADLNKFESLLFTFELEYFVKLSQNYKQTNDRFYCGLVVLLNLKLYPVYN